MDSCSRLCLYVISWAFWNYNCTPETVPVRQTATSYYSPSNTPWIVPNHSQSIEIRYSRYVYSKRQNQLYSYSTICSLYCSDHFIIIAVPINYMPYVSIPATIFPIWSTKTLLFDTLRFLRCGSSSNNNNKKRKQWWIWHCCIKELGRQQSWSFSGHTCSIFVSVCVPTIRVSNIRREIMSDSESESESESEVEAEAECVTRLISLLFHYIPIIQVSNFGNLSPIMHNFFSLFPYRLKSGCANGIVSVMVMVVAIAFSIWSVGWVGWLNVFGNECCFVG